MRSTTLDAKRLLALREQKRLTQAQLAAAVGKTLGRPVHETTISHLERGARQPSSILFAAICTALDAADGDLLVPELAA